MPADVEVARFLSAGESAADLMPALRRAVRKLHDHGGGRLLLPPGRSHLRPTAADEVAMSISNHEPGYRFVGLGLHGLRDVEVVGEATTLVSHGRLIPLAASGCQGLRVSGVTIDWEQPFHGQAEVLEAAPGDIVARLDDAIPWSVSRGRLMFWGEGWSSPLEHVFEFDAGNRRPARGSHDNCGAGWLMQWHADDLGGGRLRLRGEFPHGPATGNVLVLRPGEQRHAPAIALSACTDTVLEELTIHHAAGMGLIAERCRNVAVRRVRVVPSTGRIFSTTVDATHFTGCSGRVVIEDCHMEGQLDDPANIHGVYALVVDLVSSFTVRVQLVHPQQRGIEFARPGDVLGLARQADLMDYWQGRVAEIRRLNRQWLELTFADRLPAGIEPGDPFDNLDWHPQVEIRRCWMGGNRARGPLLGSRARTLVEHNFFATPGAAIHSGPECRFWCESGPVANLTIRKNIFDACAHEAPWGLAPINLDPQLSDPQSPARRLQTNVLIEENVFRTVNGACVRARRVEDLVIRGNQVQSAPGSPKAVVGSLPAWDIEQCSGRIEIEPASPSA